MIDLDAIRRRCERSSPGWWRAMREGNQWIKNHTVLVGASRVEGIERPWSPEYCVPAEKLEHVCRFTDDDADFIAAAHQDIPALLAVIDGLAKALEECAASYDCNGAQEYEDELFRRMRVAAAALARKGEQP